MSTKRSLKKTLLNSPSVIRDSAAIRGIFRASEKIEARFGKGRGDDFEAPDGYPLPPADLRVAISRIADGENHWNGGVQSRVSIESILSGQDLSMSDFGPILDFGSGAGRVLRQWQDLDNLELHGCDYNAEAIAWAAENLTFATWAANQLEPPLPYEADSFDLVYALSVFTHFPAPLQTAWMAEMARVVRPGEYLIFTTMGRSFNVQLTDEQQATFDKEGFVVHFPDSAGSNMCSAYHSPRYASELAASQGFETLATVEASDDSLYPQDMHLVRRKS